MAEHKHEIKCLITQEYIDAVNNWLDRIIKKIGEYNGFKLIDKLFFPIIECAGICISEKKDNTSLLRVCRVDVHNFLGNNDEELIHRIKLKIDETKNLIKNITEKDIND